MPASEVELDHRKMAMNVEHQLGHILINDDFIYIWAILLDQWLENEFKFYIQ